MKKKSVVLVTVAFIVVVLAFVIWRYFGLAITVMLDDMNALDKKDIFKIVNEHQVEIINAIDKKDFESIKAIPGIESIGREDNYIDFYCGGTGIGSSTSYYGFYYSEDNATDVLEDIEYPKGETLKPDGKGFSWDEPDGDNRFYVEKIIDGFFYYESHY